MNRSIRLVLIALAVIGCMAVYSGTAFGGSGAGAQVVISEDSPPPVVPPQPTPQPKPTRPGGKRAPSLRDRAKAVKKCKRLKNRRARSRCIKRAKRLGR